MSNNIDIKLAFQEISSLYNVTTDQIKRVLDNAFQISNNIQDNKPKLESKDIILPFCGIINETCCKAVIYNHGLYSQCTKETTNEVCKACSKLKYGRIEERSKSKPGEFVTPEGKKEVPYDKFMKKMGYSFDDVNTALKLLGLSYDLKGKKDATTKMGRGRPKKVQKEESDNEEKEEIEVTKIEINGKKYFKTADNIILNIDNYEVVGLFKNGNVETLEVE
tara:strand:+ start:3732 stop:4394 length:663 start_codon:yes stop_codon:yes gene_type:complete